MPSPSFISPMWDAFTSVKLKLHQERTYAQMWIPNQLLDDDVVQSLREHGFSSMQIEYLGWLRGTATALNKSYNPVKAAITILGRAMLNSKPNRKGDIRPMFEKFAERKRESVNPKTDIDLDEINRKFGKLEAWADKVIAQATPYNPHAESADDESTDD
jgi:hypothetical protein